MESIEQRFVSLPSPTAGRNGAARTARARFTHTVRSGRSTRQMSDETPPASGVKRAAAESSSTAKWNEGLRIADALGGGGPLPDPKVFPWGASR